MRQTKKTWFIYLKIAVRYCLECDDIKSMKDFLSDLKNLDISSLHSAACQNFLMLKLSTSTDRISARLQGYMPVLDGYRGIAILLVFLSHCIPKVEIKFSDFLNYFYKELMLSGWCGVDAFFVLSGFLITGIILDTCERPNFFRNFYIRRVLRIFPPYYITLLIFLLLYPVLKNYDFSNSLYSSQSWYWLYLDNWLWPFVNSNPFNHLWSLAIEAQFYLVWPALIYFLPRKFLTWLLGIVILCAMGIRGWLLLTNPFTLSLARLVYHNTLCRVDTLAMGALLAVWMREGFMLSLLLRMSWRIMIASGATLGILFFIQKSFNPYHNPVFQLIGYSLVSIFFGTLLVLSLAQPENSIWSRTLTWFPLKKLGTVSYGFYVYHFPFCWVFRDRLYQYIGEPYILSHLGIVFFCGILTLVVSLLSWYCLEQPSLHLKTYFSSNPDNMKSG